MHGYQALNLSAEGIWKCDAVQATDAWLRHMATMAMATGTHLPTLIRAIVPADMHIPIHLTCAPADMPTVIHNHMRARQVTGTLFVHIRTHIPDRKSTRL